MERLGVPYKGSKNKIASWIIEQLPAAEYFVDLFAGGCSVTHAALLSGKYKRIIANDISAAPQLFAEAIRGDFAGFSFVPDREEFHALKGEDEAVALLYSFGNNGKDYLWGGAFESLKQNAEKMLSAPSMHERRMFYKKFIKCLTDYEGKLDSNLEGAQRLERLQALERLQVLNLSYDLVIIPNDSVVYCDIPYINTNSGRYNGFDHERFYKWLNSVDFPVYVSEYTCPPGCVSIAEKIKTVNSAAKTTGKATEHIFIQERFLNDHCRNVLKQ